MEIKCGCEPSLVIFGACVICANHNVTRIQKYCVEVHVTVTGVAANDRIEVLKRGLAQEGGRHATTNNRRHAPRAPRPRERAAPAPVHGAGAGARASCSDGGRADLWTSPRMTL